MRKIKYFAMIIFFGSTENSKDEVFLTRDFVRMAWEFGGFGGDEAHTRLWK